MKLRAENRKHHIIYKTTCLITSRWYIGMHSTDALDDGYLGSGQRLWKSIKKHGKENHIVEILEHLNSRKELIIREGEIVTKELRQDVLCMNLRDGGIPCPGELDLTEAARAKISATSKAMWERRKADPEKLAEHIAKIITPKAIAKRASSNTGKTRSEVQKTNLKSGQATYYSSVDPEILKERGAKSAITRVIRGNSNGGRPVGIPMSDEQKARQSKGKKKDPGDRSESLKKYYNDLDPAAKLARSEKSSCTRGKIWNIEAEDGSVLQINNFTIFCKEHNLNNKAFAKTVLNKRFINGFRIA